MRPASRHLHCIFRRALRALCGIWESLLTVIVQNDGQVNFCAQQVEVAAPEN
jgi:hypothetical protein